MTHEEMVEAWHYTIHKCTPPKHTTWAFSSSAWFRTHFVLKDEYLDWYYEMQDRYGSEDD